MPPSRPAQLGLKHLKRSETDKILFGVCGGLGEYFELDSTVFRIIFVLLTLFGGLGLVLYIILALLVPASSETNRDVVQEMRQGAETFRQAVTPAAEQATHSTPRESSGPHRLGLALIVIGILFLLSNFGFFAGLNLSRLWPILLVLLGLVVLARSSERR